jgi:Calx-beta domain
MYPINRMARRVGTSTLLASFAAFSLLSSAVPSAAAQSAPTISVDDVSSVTEGGVAAFHVTVHGDHSGVSVDYETRDGTAVAGKDYTGISGTLNIPAAKTDTTLELDVPTLDDSIYEADEVFHLKLLKSSSVYTITKSVGDATIVSNDPFPTISIKDARVKEGDPLLGIANAVFEVSLSNPSSQDVTVNYQTVDGTGAGFAVGTPGPSLPGDYVKLNTTPLTFPAETNPTRYIMVAPKGDLIYEGNEQFFVKLSSAINADLVSNGKVSPTIEATGTIVDDDPKPKLSIAKSASVGEGDTTGPVSMLGLDVTLSNPSTQDVSFTYSTANGTAQTGDYSPIVNATGKIPAGSTSTRLWLTITGDDRKEADETFSVFLQTATNATLGNASCVVTILNDD